MKAGYFESSEADMNDYRAKCNKLFPHAFLFQSASEKALKQKKEIMNHLTESETEQDNPVVTGTAIMA